jgi:glycosyltransferase involved in cell wall biosynthesis
MPRIKVLYLVEDFKIGGLERVVETIYNGLDHDLCEPHIWCIAAGGDLADLFLREGKSLRILGLKSYHNPANIFRLARFIRQGGFHIVHTHAYFAGTIGRIAAFMAGTPIILHHVHTTDWDFKARHVLIERMLSTVTARIICCSDFVRDFVVSEEGISAGKVITIYNGVNDDPTGCGAPEKRRHGEKFVRVAVVASLVENKGHAVLLTAFHRLAMLNPNLELWIIGDGPLRQNLERQTDVLGIRNRVSFLGQRDDVLQLLACSDIVVLPSLYREGLGLAIIEAMSQSKPVIASNIGGIPELIEDGVNGFTVVPGDAVNLEAKLRILIADEDLRKTMGLAGRKRYEDRFSSAIMIRQIEALYYSLLMAKGIA